MERAKRVKTAAKSIVDAGNKPSAERLSSELDISQADVHRCLNYLEQEGEVETYTKEMLGKKIRMVGVNRE